MVYVTVFRQIALSFCILFIVEELLRNFRPSWTTFLLCFSFIFKVKSYGYLFMVHLQPEIEEKSLKKFRLESDQTSTDLFLNCLF